MADHDDDVERDEDEEEVQDDDQETQEEPDDDDDVERKGGEKDESQEGEKEEEKVEEEEVEEEITEPDNQDAIVALKDLGARVDSNDKERVWRVFFYEKHGDEALAQVHGLPALKEVWMLGTKISAQMKDRFAEQFPKVKVYYG